MTEYDLMDRKTLKRERARYPLVKQRITEVDARAAELERERDGAEEMYQRDVAPLQREISDIEDQSIEDIEERRPLDPQREQRRKNLAHEIETVGVILANKIDDINKRVEIVKAERAKLMADLPNLNVVETQLFRSGDEQKQIRHEALLEAVRAIENAFLFVYRPQVEAMRDAHKTAKEKAARDKSYRSQVNDYQQKLTRMEATLSAAGAANARMRDEAAEIYKELINN